MTSNSNSIPDHLYLRAIKEKCQESFPFFVQFFFKRLYGHAFIWSWHHEQIADALIKIFTGKTTFLIINMPPRYGKTELVIKCFNAWTFAKNPQCKSLQLSYSKDLALSNAAKIREMINHPLYQSFWPEAVIPRDRNAKELWETRSGGQLKSGAAGGTVTGFGAGSIHENTAKGFCYHGGIFIDDPLKPDDANSDTLRESVNARWDETIKSRRNSPTTPVVVIMQRLHQQDFVGTLLDDKEFHWQRLILPAILNEGTETEQPLWQEKHTLIQLHAMKKKNPYVFAGQYQQSPSPKGGGLIQTQWFSRYEDPNDVFQRSHYLFMTADTAYTAKTTNDPTVIQLWGAESGKRLYLLDQARGHWEFPELVRNVCDFWNKKHMSNRLSKQPATLFIEGKASGLSLIQTLKKHGLPAKNWKPKSYKFPDDKVGRVKEASWNLCNGDIWLPANAPWAQGLIDECAAFTDNDTHAHDDQVDCLTMAVSIWRKMGGGTCYQLD